MTGEGHSNRSLESKKKTGIASRRNNGGPPYRASHADASISRLVVLECVWLKPAAESKYSQRRTSNGDSVSQD